MVKSGQGYIFELEKKMREFSTDIKLPEKKIPKKKSGFSNLSYYDL